MERKKRRRKGVQSKKKYVKKGWTWLDNFHWKGKKEKKRRTKRKKYVKNAKKKKLDSSLETKKGKA